MIKRFGFLFLFLFENSLNVKMKKNNKNGLLFDNYIRVLFMIVKRKHDIFMKISSCKYFGTIRVWDGDKI